VIANFYDALKPGGFLVVGPSSIEAGTLLSPVEGTRGVFTRIEGAVKVRPSFVRSAAAQTPAGVERVRIEPHEAGFGPDLRKQFERALLARFRGAGVVANRKLEVLEIVGDVAPYMMLPEGKATFSLLKLIPEIGLFLEIEKLVRDAESSGAEAKRDRVPYQAGAASGDLKVEVIPLGTAPPDLFIILFEPVAGVREDEWAAGSDPRNLEIARLRQDLVNARQRLLTMVEEQQQKDEDNQKTAYETLSANEELQSLNEELETAKEELQSLNEELTTVNQELVSNNAALREARHFATSIVETIESPVLILDDALRIHTANESFRRMFRLDADEIKGQLLWSISNGCWDVPMLREMLDRILPSQGIIKGFEISREFPSIGHKSLMLNGRQLDALDLILLGIEDLTDLQDRADAKLLESETRFTSIADSAPVMIWVAGLDKLCTFFNKGWLEFTGRTFDQELGNGWAEGVHPDDLDQCLEIYASSFDGRRPFEMEYRLQRADGEYRWLLDRGIPRIDSQGGFCGYVGSCTDITDLKVRQEEDLSRQKRETVGALAQGVVHDFNNLLGGILSNSELALAGVDGDSKPMEELQRIRDAAIRGADIVRQLMVYAGRENEVSEPVNVSAIVEDMIELLKISISKHVTLETDLIKNLPTVRANPSLIRQVVMNLITNASEAIGDRDGTIRVTTRKVTGGPSSGGPKGLPGGDYYVQLEVTDTGRGMTSEVQARIFDPFFTTKLTGGHGHGLVVVQRIAERLHGSVEVSSVPEKGSTFKIFLPGDAAARQDAVPIRGLAKETLGSLHATVLVVDDEDLLRQAVSMILRKRGLTVLEASDGTAALDMLRGHHDEIDLLLLDITLPGAPSQKVYDEAVRLKPNLPVIITSAHNVETAGASLSREVGNFLRKPFLSADLIDKIRRLLPSAALKRGANAASRK
jgi:PAS domain S-box-containing protein